MDERSILTYSPVPLAQVYYLFVLGSELYLFDPLLFFISHPSTPR
jgi:hypothetical protein